MKALLQRVSRADVALAGAADSPGGADLGAGSIAEPIAEPIAGPIAEPIAEIGPGLVVLVCTEKDDGEATADYLAAKIAKLRIFADENGKTNLSLKDVGGEALVISQFTLAAEWRRGNRPSFSAAADPETAEKLYEYFAARLAAEGVPVKTGRFRSHMALTLTNDGPVTIWMDSGGR